MKLCPYFFVALLVFSLACNPAKADTDYRCLKLCVAKGQTYYQCNPKCSFGNNKEMKAKDQDLLVKTPISKSGNVVRIPLPAVEKNVQTNFVCLKGCLGQGLQYGFCSKSCEKQEEKK